jgi:hypothetical protein
MRKQATTRWLAVGIFLTLASCSNTGTSSNPEYPSSSNTPEKNAADKASAPAPKPIAIPAGTILHVTLDQTVSTKTNASGDHFDASLSEPLTLEGKDLLPVGTKASGTVTQAKSAGHLKGGAVLGLALDSITVDGKAYAIQTTIVQEAGKGRGQRTAIGAGGGAALGAIVGAIAGGGKGAAIGAAAGAGAGTAGAAFTGNRDITLPAETRLSFKLNQPLEFRRR